MKRDILRQIQEITAKFVSESMSVAECYPKLSENEILWQGFTNISFVLKNQKYEVLYNECLKERAFNFVLLDGAIIQMMYKFDRNNLISHRLAFLPNPNIEKYQDNPEEYEERYYGNRLFVDIAENDIVVSPFRFDFDNDTGKFIEYDHPYSHLTIGNYRNCRIPISSPLSPNRFIQFILRNFYFDKYKDVFSNNDFECSLKFDNTITNKERKLLHLNFE